MKTLEEVNGQKVWAVDTTAVCDGCMFLYSIHCNSSVCSPLSRPDKRNVIFLPYEEEKEKTFTLSQINEVIESLIARNDKSDSDIHWNASLRVLKSKLEQL